VLSDCEGLNKNSSVRIVCKPVNSAEDSEGWYKSKPEKQASGLDEKEGGVENKVLVVPLKLCSFILN
jgi:hypothetical protein